MPRGELTVLQEVQREDVRWLMSTHQGRRFVYKVLADCGIYQRSFTGSEATTAFAEGRRAVGLQLLDEITRLAFNDYLKMLGEHAPTTTTTDDGGR